MGCRCCKMSSLRKPTVVNAKKVTLLVLGLDNSGKTTVVKRLTKAPLDDVTPTVGFAVYDLEEKGCNVSLYDVGGGSKIRDIWKQYYADVHGVIFVVDSYDVARMNECRVVLTSLLRNVRISGKPILLLANKQDIDGALDEIDIVEKLELESLVNKQKCPTLVELCAAKIAAQKNDAGIANGFKWLIRNITKDYPALNNRVLVDMACQEELEKVAMDNRKKRLEQIREDRNKNSALIDEDFDEVDPFRPISQLVIKSHQNGEVHQLKPAVLPQVIEDYDNDDGDVTIQHSRSAQSELFFNSQDWSSTTELLEGLTMTRQKDFLERPKSSGAIEFKTKKKKKKKRLRVKNNKTAPVPFVDFARPRNGPIPAIFDPSYHTEITVLDDRQPIPNGNAHHPPIGEISHPNELVLSAAGLSSNF